MGIARRLMRTMSVVRSRQRRIRIDVASPKDDHRLARLDTLKFDWKPTEMSAPVISPGDSFDPSKDSFHAAFRPIITLAQCFSMVPVSGVSSPDASRLKFTWRSPKILYSAIACFGASTMTVFNTLRFTSMRISAENMTSFVFYSTTMIAMLLFVGLARQWPCLVLTWEKLEREFATRHRKLTSRSLAARFKIMTTVVMLLALLEHALSIAKGYRNAVQCATLRGDTDILGTYFQSQFPQVFSLVSYSLWKGILVDAVNILSTFSWNFVDLFVILISMALADRFRQLNARLYAIRGKAMPEWWWAEARSDYNHLASLTRRVDSQISGIVLLSFATDLYFICMQLLLSLNPMRDTVQKVYFYFSFGFLLARTTAVSLYAAFIHDEAELPAPVLYSVSGSGYCTEVMRFLTQVTTDNISLTGMKFFSITRSLVLTVAGTIVTYELVLVQFNSVQQVDPTNITTACEYDYSP